MSEGRSIQAEGTGSAKALRQECVGGRGGEEGHEVGGGPGSLGLARVNSLGSHGGGGRGSPL